MTETPAETSQATDRFARQSDKYSAFRPTYPAELFTFVAELCARHELAWDCATGNGQAARGLVDHFTQVIATDASAGQIEYAWRHPRITYRVGREHNSHLADGSTDLVTVATALHWLDLPSFYEEVRRVLTRDGILAAWGYQDTRVSPAVDEVMRHFRTDILGRDWAFEVRLLTERYRTVDFPFREIPTPHDFAASGEWQLADVLGYLESWSATQRYRERTGADPLDAIRTDLARAWGEPATRRRVEWPLFMRIGRLPHT